MCERRRIFVSSDLPSKEREIHKSCAVEGDGPEIEGRLLPIIVQIAIPIFDSLSPSVLEAETRSLTAGKRVTASADLVPKARKEGQRVESLAKTDSCPSLHHRRHEF